MLTAQLLETAILASIALGAAIFVLVAVLPSILPRAMTAAQREWDKALDEILQEREETTRAGGPMSEEFRDEVKRVASRFGELQVRIQDFGLSLKLGWASAAAFLSAASLGLWALTLPPFVDGDGIIFAPVSSTFEGVLFLAFLVGFGLMFGFAASFFRIVDMYLKGAIPEGTGKARGVPREPREG
ncbi:MAG: hypothetical protein ACE5IJ_03335 [Thermoplasmata archaeon]